MSTTDGAELNWRKSWRSAAYGACVEVAMTPEVVLLRDSKHPDGPRLRIDRAAWTAFLTAVREGEFDRTDESAGTA